MSLLSCCQMGGPVKLEKIFDLGHKVAVSRNPVHHVVFHPSGTLLPEGHYYVKDQALDVMVQRRGIAASDLGARLGSDDELAYSWAPDAGHCWCTLCASAREGARTQAQ